MNVSGSFCGLEKASPNMGRARGQCAAWTDRGDTGRGKFCRKRHVLPRFRRGVARKLPVYRRFVVARHLLDLLPNGTAPRAARIGSLTMLFALGAVSSAIEAFQSLASSASSKVKTGVGQPAPGSFDPVSGGASPMGPTASSGCGSGARISPATMSALLAAQGQSPGTSASAVSASAALQDLFSQIDGNGDGRISRSEFEAALGAGGTNLAQADDVFGKLDTNGDGSVSLEEMTSALKGAGGHEHGRGRHHHVASSDGSGSADGSSGVGGTSPDSLLAAIDSSVSTTNSDGSVTTTTTLADGIQVTLTSPPSSSTSGTASSSYSLMQQAIQRETEAISSAVTRSLSVSV